MQNGFVYNQKKRKCYHFLIQWLSFNITCIPYYTLFWYFHTDFTVYMFASLLSHSMCINPNQYRNNTQNKNKNFHDKKRVLNILCQQHLQINIENLSYNTTEITKQPKKKTKISAHFL